MRSLSLCVFIATYFRLEVNGHTNEDSVWLYEHASPTEREALQDLWMKKSIDLAEEVTDHEQTYEVFDTFGSYKDVCEKCEEPNSGKLNVIVAFKQLFCIPWLLCSDHLLNAIYQGQI